MKTHSVLENVTRDCVRNDPFPYLVVDDCLPQSYFDALAATYPSNDCVVDFCRENDTRKFEFDGDRAAQNCRYDISSFQALAHPERLPEPWLDFIRYHTSRDFFLEASDLLRDEITSVYPTLEQTLGKPMDAFTTGVRNRSACDVSLDCQVGINTPATNTSSVRRVHVDAGVELFAILLYFKHPDDDTAGGDLEIFRWKNPRKKRFRRSEVEETDAEHVATVEYKANRMVMFVNSQDSLHAVTPRTPSPHTRRLVNIIAEVDTSIPQGLFSRPKRKDLAYFRRKIRTEGRKLLGKVRQGRAGGGAP